MFFVNFDGVLHKITKYAKNLYLDATAAATASSTTRFSSAMSLTISSVGSLSISVVRALRASVLSF